MTHRFEGERTLMRIFIGESDRSAQGPHQGKPLYEALVVLFRERASLARPSCEGLRDSALSA